jgi:hypothetical protein
MTKDRDQTLQDLLDGAPRNGADLDAEARRELAAYKLVYQALGAEPPSYLPADFAQRVTAAAFARDAFGWTFWLLTGLLVLFGIAVSVVVLAIALPPDSVVRSLVRNLSLRGADLAPVLNASSVLVTFVAAFALDHWLSRED